MSDNFYDFDKDDIFDEVYLKKSTKKPQKKEFEVEIPMPQNNIKSTMPASPQKKAPVPEKAAKPKRKKLSSTALTLSIIGMVVSCILVFVGSFLATIFGWNYIPSFEKSQQEQSVVEDIKQIEEYVEISDDGSYVEVVPMYRETEGDDAPPSPEPTEDEETSDNEDASNDEENGGSEESSGGSADEDGSDDTSGTGTEDEIITIE